MSMPSGDLLSKGISNNMLMDMLTLLFWNGPGKTAENNKAEGCM